MRRILLTLIGLAGVAGLAAYQPANAADNVESLLADCGTLSGYDQSWCRAEQNRFVGQYQRSLEKDYHSQRSVASCFFGGCDGAVTVDRKQACAWRLLILQSGYTFVDSTDGRNHRSDCAGLDTEADRQEVRTLANALMMRIYDKELPPAP